jgi:hypothetical protein
MADRQERDLLLAALAEFAFGKGRVGRKQGSRGWTDRKLGDLYEAMQEYDKIDVTEDGPFLMRRRSDAELAKLIAKKSAGRFHSEEAIRRHLPDAREWFYKWFADAEPPDDWEPPEPDWNDLDD